MNIFLKIYLGKSLVNALKYFSLERFSKILIVCSSIVSLYKILNFDDDGWLMTYIKWKDGNRVKNGFWYFRQDSFVFLVRFTEIQWQQHFCSKQELFLALKMSLERFWSRDTAIKDEEENFLVVSIFSIPSWYLSGSCMRLW